MFEEWHREHLKAPSTIFEHQNMIGHKTTVENKQGGAKYDHGHKRSYIHQSQ